MAQESPVTTRKDGLKTLFLSEDIGIHESAVPVIVWTRWKLRGKVTNLWSWCRRGMIETFVGSNKTRVEHSLDLDVYYDSKV